MRTILIALCLICTASQSYAQEKTALTPAEVQILNKLHAANLQEIAASKLATSRARNEGVKNYGQELIKHHSKADSDIKALASRANVKLAEPPPDEKLKSLKKNINPATFDRAFLDQMSDAHEAAIAQVREAEGIAASPELQTMLKDLLPVLQQHREQAVKLLENNPF